MECVQKYTAVYGADCHISLSDIRWYSQTPHKGVCPAN